MKGQKIFLESIFIFCKYEKLGKLYGLVFKSLWASRKKPNLPFRLLLKIPFMIYYVFCIFLKVKIAQ